MKSMWLPLATIFFMTDLYRAGGNDSLPPGSATDPSTVCNKRVAITFCGNVNFKKVVKLAPRTKVTIWFLSHALSIII